MLEKQKQELENRLKELENDSTLNLLKIKIPSAYKIIQDEIDDIRKQL